MQKIRDFSMVFSLFWNIVSITSIVPFGRPIKGTPGPKTNYMVNLNNFSTTRPILYLMVLLDRVF